MKPLFLLIFLSQAFAAGAQTPAQRDSAYHTRKDPKHKNPYADADSVKTKRLISFSQI